jgi:hypothetical protein
MLQKNPEGHISKLFGAGGKPESSLKNFSRLIFEYLNENSVSILFAV